MEEKEISNQNLTDQKKNLLGLIIDFSDKTDFKILYKCRNKKLFSTLVGKKSNYKYFTSNPCKLKPTNSTIPYQGHGLSNVFEVFESKKGETLLAYPMRDCNINIYDLGLSQQKLYLTGHTSRITVVAYYNDIDFGKDYLVSFAEDRTHRVYECENFSCLKVIDSNGENIKIFGMAIFRGIAGLNIYSGDFFSSGNIRVLDFEGSLKLIENAGEGIFSVSIWRENPDQPYLITTNKKDVRIFNLNDNSLFKIYSDKKKGWIYSAIVVESQGKRLLLAADYLGFLNYYDFFSGERLEKININKEGIRGISMWNQKLAYVSSGAKVLIVDIHKKSVEHTIEVNETTSYFFTMVKFEHPLYGESLLCGTGRGDNRIFMLTPSEQ